MDTNQVHHDGGKMHLHSEQAPPPPYTGGPGPSPYGPMPGGAVYQPQPPQPYQQYPPVSQPPMMYSQPPPQQQQQQQQQQVVVVNNNQQSQLPIQITESYSGAVVLSCFVFWCCNWLFGLIAFILALVASSSAATDPASARQFGRASTWVSVAGIIVTVIIVAIVVGVVVSAPHSPQKPRCPNYEYLSTCYNFRSYETSSRSCHGVYDSFNRFCYY